MRGYVKDSIVGFMRSDPIFQNKKARGLQVCEHFNMHGQFIIDHPHCMLIAFGDDVTFASHVHVLAHDVPAGTVAAENPARLICSTEDYPSKHRDTADDLSYLDASYALQGGRSGARC